MVASFNLSKSLFRFRKLLQSKPRGRRFVGKRRLFVFQKSLTVIGRKNTWQILMLFKMATALKADQINKGYLNWLKKTSWGLQISYRQLSFLMLRLKLYRLGTIIVSCLKHLLILLVSKNGIYLKLAQKTSSFLRKPLNKVSSTPSWL